MENTGINMQPNDTPENKSNGQAEKSAKSGQSNRKRFSDWCGNMWQPIWGRLRKFVSMPFLIALLLSLAAWYAIKLSHTYQTEIPIVVNVDGHMFEVSCMVEGQGTRLFARRHYKGKPLELSWSDLDVSPSVINEGWLVISPYSLQNAISSRNTDVKFLSVGTIPEIEL